MSLIYFQVLDIISQPYSADFVQLFLPIINNEDITGSLRNEEGTDAVSQFLGEDLVRLHHLGYVKPSLGKKFFCHDKAVATLSHPKYCHT